jgi:hypothetical protein
LDISIKIGILSGQISDGDDLQLTVQCSIANKGREEIFNLSAMAGLHLYRQKTIQGIATDGAWVTVTQPITDPLQAMTQAALTMEASATYTELAANLLPEKETSGVLLAKGPTQSEISLERPGVALNDRLLVVVARFGTSLNEHKSRIASSFILQRHAKGDRTNELDTHQNLRLLPIYESRLL